MIIKFEMEHCPLCRKMDVILETLNYEPDQNYLITLDDMELAKKYNIQSCPTLLKIQDGKIIDRIVGMASFNRIKSFIEE